MSVIHVLTIIYGHRRFAFFFFSLLATMIAAPILSAMGLSTAIMELFLAFTIFSAVLVALFSYNRYLGIGMLVLIFAFRCAHIILSYEPLLTSSQGVGAAICFISALIMLRFVLSEGSTVTSERIYAALNVYLLLGLICGLLFCIFEEEWPGSFLFQGATLGGSRQNLLAHTIYFSFVTLGTLGYGDVIPLGGPARALAVTEAMVGQMYLVVVVARLVSMYKSKTERDGVDIGDENGCRETIGSDG